MTALSTTSKQRPFADVVRDVVALTKPRITLMVLVTAAGGMGLAPESLPLGVMLVMLLTTTTVVAAANALNCWLERDSDRLMARTAKRPLPDQRLNPRVALVLGVVLGLVSVPVLTFVVNPLTGLLGAVALVSYVAVYTPMKRASSAALLVGAIPGALPPLMGWTAATGSLDAPGLVLFAILFIWQVPHFLAISIYRQADYDRAGLKTLPSERGVKVALAQSAFYAAMLLAVSTLLYVFRVAGLLYLVSALVLGVGFFASTIQAMRAADPVKGARKSFIASLLYLTLLFAALMVDVLIA
ncbi:MAG: heme o synthase [Myxococcota bacterium]